MFRPALLLLLTAPAWAQDPLSLRAAVRLALRQNAELVASGAALDASTSRVAQARGGALPKVNYAESFTRGNNPVYVFGSLLTQHQFGAANFDIARLNRPGALNNFQSQFTIDQPVYDAGQTKSAVRSADLGRQMTVEQRRGVEMQVIAAVVRAYSDAVLAAESLRVAEQALRSAEADLKRAQDIRAAGMSTDVDVLSIRVHLAAVTEQRIGRAAALEVARAALNDAMGLPLDSQHSLTTALSPLDTGDQALESIEKGASGARPESRQSRLAVDLARAQTDAARAALRPQLRFHAAWEVDRQRFVDRGAANWMAAIGFRWNLFNGFSDKARVAEAAYNIERSRATAERTDSAVRLQVRQAWAGLSAAQQRIEVAKAAAAEAQESLRITQNRYAAGLATVTDLLRTETAAAESRIRYLAAVHDQRVAAAALELSAGSLTADSEVLN
jgi:outer membrane protein TolC